MKKIWKKAFLFAVFASVFRMQYRSASADAVVKDEDTTYDRYIAFGADLTVKEKAAVMGKNSVLQMPICQTIK